MMMPSTPLAWRLDSADFTLKEYFFWMSALSSLFLVYTPLLIYFFLKNKIILNKLDLYNQEKKSNKYELRSHDSLLKLQSP